MGTEMLRFVRFSWEVTVKVVEIVFGSDSGFLNMIHGISLTINKTWVHGPEYLKTEKKNTEISYWLLQDSGTNTNIYMIIHRKIWGKPSGYLQIRTTVLQQSS